MSNKDVFGNQVSMISKTKQENLWDMIQDEENDNTTQNVFSKRGDESSHRQKLRKHKAWLQLIRPEYPPPQTEYRVGVYIRFFNQTKYDDYLNYHKQEFADTIALCPRWTLVDFYVDNGATAPKMENAKDWCRLLNDCFAGKIDLIITQKVSNVTRKPEELALIARLLACQEHPVGMYFVNEELFTLASYYQNQMRDTDFLSEGLDKMERITDGEENGAVDK